MARHRIYFLVSYILVSLVYLSSAYEEATSTEPPAAEYPNLKGFPMRECSSNSDCSQIEGSLCDETSKTCVCAAKLVPQQDKCVTKRAQPKASVSREVKKESIREMVIDYVLYAVVGTLLFGGVSAAPIKGESLASRMFSLIRRRRTMDAATPATAMV